MYKIEENMQITFLLNFPHFQDVAFNSVFPYLQSANIYVYILNIAKII